MKVHLILVDGMRPDALDSNRNPYIKELLDSSLYTLQAKTVMPSVTLPCHMSLFHSVECSRHGILTNTYMPQVRPIDGLFEQLKAGRKKNGMFYNWEQLRDLSRPGSLSVSGFFAGNRYGYEKANQMVTEASMKAMRENDLDFIFTYLGWPDDAGHDYNWMSPEYLHSVDESLLCIRKMIENAPEDCLTIITADHGGHERTHGTDAPEDMLIPVILHGGALRGTLEQEVSIKDLAPTVVKLLGCDPAPEWEGTSLL